MTTTYDGDTTEWWARPSPRDASSRSRLASAMTQTAAGVWDRDADRRAECEVNMRRYSGRGLRGLFLAAGYQWDPANLRVNITKAVTETLTARVGSARPRARLLTSGADWSQTRRVKNLQRFLDGQSRAAGVQAAGKAAFRDAMLAGTGILHTFPHIGKATVAVERVFPLEVVVDEAEAVNGNPQNLFRTKFLDKNVLAALFPKQRAAIMALSPVRSEDVPFDAVQLDTRSTSTVQVWEAWHLATWAHDGTPVCGRHVLAADDVLLCDEDYDRDYFPFAFFHWAKPLRGFWADAAVTEVRGLEQECNVLLQKVQRAMQLGGQPWLLVPDSAKVPPAKFTDEVMLQVPYKGQVPPTVQTHMAVHPQIIDQAWTLQRKAYEQLGVTDLQTSGARPVGIESGRALEQLGEEQAVRFKSVAQDFEQFLACDVSRHLLAAAEELDTALKAQGRGGYTVRTAEGRKVLDIKWADAKISPDDLTVECWPTSSLPTSPAGRTEELERWQQAGWITPQRAMSLMELPDLESESDLATADSDLVAWQLERMLDDGKSVLPLEVQAVDYAKQRVIFAIERATQNGVPEDHIDQARLFLEALKAMTPEALPVGPNGQPLVGGVAPVAGVVGPAAQAPVGGAMPPDVGGGIPQ